MKAVVAVQRKLLEMIYTISKKQVPYNKNYLKEAEMENESMKTIVI